MLPAVGNMVWDAGEKVQDRRGSGAPLGERAVVYEAA